MKRVDKLFWGIFVLFCVGTIIMFWAFDMIDMSKVGPGGDVILVISLLLCGVVLRQFVRKNYDEKNRRFKMW